jgi:hypothetical protein
MPPAETPPTPAEGETLPPPQETPPPSGENVNPEPPAGSEAQGIPSPEATKQSNKHDSGFGRMDDFNDFKTPEISHESPASTENPSAPNKDTGIEEPGTGTSGGGAPAGKTGLDSGVGGLDDVNDFKTPGAVEKPTGPNGEHPEDAPKSRPDSGFFDGSSPEAPSKPGEPPAAPKQMTPQETWDYLNKLLESKNSLDSPSNQLPKGIAPPEEPVQVYTVHTDVPGGPAATEGVNTGEGAIDNPEDTDVPGSPAATEGFNTGEGAIDNPEDTDVPGGPAATEGVNTGEGAIDNPEDVEMDNPAEGESDNPDENIEDEVDFSDEEMEDPGVTTVYHNNDGTVTTITDYANGTSNITTTLSDGTEATTSMAIGEDGSSTITFEDGTSNSVINNGDGTFESMQVLDDGTIKGGTTTVNPNGAFTTNYSDGTISFSRVNEDNSTTTLSYPGNGTFQGYTVMEDGEIIDLPPMRSTGDPEVDYLLTLKNQGKVLTNKTTQAAMSQNPAQADYYSKLAQQNATNADNLANQLANTPNTDPALVDAARHVEGHAQVDAEKAADATIAGHSKRIQDTLLSGPNRPGTSAQSHLPPEIKSAQQPGTEVIPKDGNITGTFIPKKWRKPYLPKVEPKKPPVSQEGPSLPQSTQEGSSQTPKKRPFPDDNDNPPEAGRPSKKGKERAD